MAISTASALANSNTTTTSSESAPSTTASRLARAYGIIVRQITELLTMLFPYHGPDSLRESVEVTPEEAADLHVNHSQISLLDDVIHDIMCFT